MFYDFTIASLRSNLILSSCFCFSLQAVFWYFKASSVSLSYLSVPYLRAKICSYWEQVITNYSLYRSISLFASANSVFTHSKSIYVSKSLIWFSFNSLRACSCVIPMSILLFSQDELSWSSVCKLRSLALLFYWIETSRELISLLSWSNCVLICKSSLPIED